MQELLLLGSINDFFGVSVRWGGFGGLGGGTAIGIHGEFSRKIGNVFQLIDGWLIELQSFDLSSVKSDSEEELCGDDSELTKLGRDNFNRSEFFLNKRCE